MDIVIIRPPLVYGPGVKANFYKLFKIINSKFYLPFKKISNKRSFIFIENLVDFIILCCKSKKVSNQKFLISDLDPISSTKLIKLIYKAIGKKERLFYLPINFLLIINKLLFGSLSKILESLEIDNSESFEITKWKPKYSSEEGLTITAHWFMRENR